MVVIENSVSSKSGDFEVEKSLLFIRGEVKVQKLGNLLIKRNDVLEVNTNSFFVIHLFLD